MLTYSFLYKDQGKIEISKQDEYIKSLDSYNLNFFHEVDTKDEYIQKAVDSVLSFDFNEKVKIETRMKSIQKRWLELGLPALHVKFVRTEGSEMRNLAYTRGDCVYIPSNYFSMWTSLKYILSHEIFHVLSRSNQNKREDIYKFFGFKKVEPLNIDFVLRNPDAPVNNYSLVVWNWFRKREVIPFIQSTGKKYFPFRYCLFDVKTKEIISASSTSMFFKVGVTTQYVAHAEEICADFFSVLFVGKLFKNPWKVWKFKRALVKALKE